MRIFFIFFILLYPYYLHSKVINLQYEIDWKSIHLADVFWNISFDDYNYEIEFIIESYGFTDKIYDYRSHTIVHGYIEDNHLRPISYKSKTKSSKQDVYSNIDFDKNGIIINFDISKNINNDQLLMQNKLIDNYLYYTDPISQLTQYILFMNNSNRKIIDGLNIYEISSNYLHSVYFEKNNPTVYNGESNILELTFPLFFGLHKIDKKNNLKKIQMYFADINNTIIPMQYDIYSKKFNAKLFLKNYQIK